MSLQTWKDEFYPKPAHQVPESEALQHSLQKWIGLRSENLNKHKLKHSLGIITDSSKEQLFIDSTSCALCSHYLDKDGEDECPKCPLTLKRGFACDDGDNPPYLSLTCDNDPEPMINLIQLAISESVRRHPSLY